ncbi:MAG: hypothetical protein HQL20_01135 [Candidatus Omnitrophica bacterium]|nr:hypothetical protein [Candidatus Omnitrophota bacterium]
MQKMLAEINANLECCEVLEQRQFIANTFELKAFTRARESSGSQFSPEVLAYAADLEKFNQAFQEVKYFAAFYSASMDNKNRANAEILHARKEALAELTIGLKPRILLVRNQISALLDTH